MRKYLVLGLLLFGISASEAAFSSGGAALVSQANTWTAAQTFSSATITSARFAGTTTNDNAPVGGYGEYFSSATVRSSAIALSNGNSFNIASIALTAGDWDIRANAGFLTGTATAVTSLQVSISTTSATLSAGDTKGVSDSIGQMLNSIAGTLTSTTSDDVVHVGIARASISATTTYFMVVNAAFTVSTLTSYGGITARRIR